MNKEVRFDLYCSHCMYFINAGDDDPCNECLTEPSNEDSHKPVHFKRQFEIPFIYYLLPDPNVPNWTLDRAKSEKWDHVPDKNELKLYFEKRDYDYYEKWEAKNENS